MVHVGEGDAGCGVFVDEWAATTGEGLAALPEPFREWLDVGKAQVSEFEMRVKPTEPKKPYLNTAVLEVDGVVQHSKADGAAFVHPCTVTFDDGPTRRGVAVVAQRDGQVSRRILPLTFAEDGTIGSQPPVYQDEGAPEEPWIGVPPPEGVTISWQLNKPIHGGVLPEG